MAQKDPSRTEKATGRRIKKARDEGNVAKSQEVSKTLIILAGLFGLRFYLEYMGKDLVRLFHWFFVESFYFDPTQGNIYELVLKCALDLARLVLPVILFVGLVAYLALRFQVGKLWAPKVFKPKWGRLFNPMAGLRRMFIDLKTLIRLGKSLLQAICIGIAPYLVLKGEMVNIIPLFYHDARTLAIYMLQTAMDMALYASMPMLAIAAFDLWYTRWDYAENLKMTKDEIKDERKQMEGDMVIKQKQRQKMLKMMMQRMLSDVPKADVVVTNPTHLAVALQYNPMVAPAPLVLAKGADHLAQKIKDIARENHIPIRENKPLAQALYKNVEVGDTIPEELFQAVAALLAQLHKFKRPGAV